MCIATFLFSLLIHLNTKSTVVICIYNISEKRSKILLNIFLFHVDLAHYQEAKRTEFIHSLINCGQTFQGFPNSLLKARLQLQMSQFGVILIRIQSECGRIRTRVASNTDTFYTVLFLILLHQCIASNTEKLVAVYSHNIVKPSFGHPQKVPKR